MLIYRNDGKLFCISKKALQLAGYHDIEHFNAEHSDYSELFIKRPGYIYNFENFSWLSFLRNANQEQKRVLIGTKDNATYECELSLETIYPVEFDENTPEFFYQVEFKNLRLSDSSPSAYEDYTEPLPEEPAFKESVPEESRLQKSSLETVAFTEASFDDIEMAAESKKEEKTPGFGFDTEVSAKPADTKESESPLDLVDFDFGAPEEKKEEPQEILFEAEEKESSAQEPPQSPEIGLKTERQEPLRIEPAQKESDGNLSDIFEVDQGDEPAPPTPPENEEISIELPDIAKVSSTLGLPETMVRAFIGEFVTTYIDDLPEIEAAVASKNFHAVKKEALKLKGIASNLRMESLSQTLERVLKSESGSDIAAVWEEVDAYMRRVAPIYAPQLALEADSRRIEEAKPEKEDTKELSTPHIEPRESAATTEPASTSSKKLRLEEKDTGETIIFDPNEAADALGLPESLILEFVNDFIEQAREEKRSFEEAYEKGDIVTINEVAHKLKGVAANLRIEDMRQLMENVQHAKDPEEVEKELIDFYHKLAALNKMMAKEYA